MSLEAENRGLLKDPVSRSAGHVPVSALLLYKQHLLEDGSINLLTVNFLQRGQRGETVTSLVKVEFGEKLLGESPKVDCGPGQPAEFNYISSLSVTFEDPLTLDEIATKPIVCKYGACEVFSSYLDPMIHNLVQDINLFLQRKRNINFVIKFDTFE